MKKYFALAKVPNKINLLSYYIDSPKSLWEYLERTHGRVFYMNVYKAVKGQRNIKKLEQISNHTQKPNF